MANLAQSKRAVMYGVRGIAAQIDSLVDLEFSISDHGLLWFVNKLYLAPCAFPWPRLVLLQVLWFEILQLMRVTLQAWEISMVALPTFPRADR